MFHFYYCMVLVALFFVAALSIGSCLKGEWKKLYHDLFWPQEENNNVN